MTQATAKPFQGIENNTMAAHITEPRNAARQPEFNPELRQMAEHESASGRWEREAEQHHRPVHEDSATRSSRIYFFVILAVIVATFVVFLLLRPQ